MTTEQVLPDDIKLRHAAQVEHALDWKHERKGFAEWLGYKAVRFFKRCASFIFRKRYAHRAVMLETVAAIPGMVGSTFVHLRSLRAMKHDHGRIRTLVDEAENERMHLMVFKEIAKPTTVDKALVKGMQAVFFVGYSLGHIFNKRAAHRFVGFLEEEAVNSYTEYLKEIDEGRVPNVDAPAIAKKYWNLKDDAKLRDVVIAVRNDEAEHRDVNHRFASELEKAARERKEASAAKPAVKNPPAA